MGHQKREKEKPVDVTAIREGHRHHTTLAPSPPQGKVNAGVRKEGGSAPSGLGSDPQQVESEAAGKGQQSAEMGRGQMCGIYYADLPKREQENPFQGKHYLK